MVRVALIRLSKRNEKKESMVKRYFRAISAVICTLSRTTHNIHCPSRYLHFQDHASSTDEGHLHILRLYCPWTSYRLTLEQARLHLGLDSGLLRLLPRVIWCDHVLDNHWTGLAYVGCYQLRVAGS